jgi:hypothetical protein
MRDERTSAITQLNLDIQKGIRVRRPSRTLGVEEDCDAVSIMQSELHIIHSCRFCQIGVLCRPTTCECLWARLAPK